MMLAFHVLVQLLMQQVASYLPPPLPAVFFCVQAMLASHQLQNQRRHPLLA